MNAMLPLPPLRSPTVLPALARVQGRACPTAPSPTPTVRRTSGSARVTTARPRRGPAAPAAVLPLELRQVVQRYPVTLYSAPDCTPCDSGRRLLQQRGVPYSERLIVSGDDAAGARAPVGGRTVPALTIGAQPLRGLSEADWTAYLDAAGYPRESRLPRGWQPPRGGAAGRACHRRVRRPRHRHRAGTAAPVRRRTADSPGTLRF